MSARVKLAGKLPGDEPVNGIDFLAEELCDRWAERDPDSPASLLVIGVMRVRKFETLDGGDGVQRQPMIEFVRLEALGALGRKGLPHLGLASTAHQELLLQVAQTRTGTDPLPIDAASAIDNHQVL